MAQEDLTELQKVPMPKGLSGLTEEQWDAFSAETQQTLLSHFQCAIIGLGISQAQLNAGEYPGGVGGNTAEGLTQIFPTEKLPWKK